MLRGFVWEQNYMFHSVRDGSYADRVGFSKRRNNHFSRRR